MDYTSVTENTLYGLNIFFRNILYVYVHKNTTFVIMHEN